MAIFHFTTQVISRGEGRSAVSAISYRRGERMLDERQGVVHDYRNKPGVIHSEMSIPHGAPEWVDAFREGGAEESEKLWNMIEELEKRGDSQLAREIEFSLPNELRRDENIELARGFIEEQFVGRGMIADWAMHMEDANNPHVHVMLTMRPLEEDGFGSKKVKVMDEETGEPKRDWRGKIVYLKGDLWGGDDLLNTWREAWAVHQNRVLRERGFGVRVDHRSHAARGIDVAPTKKIGAGALAIERKGGESDRYQIYQEELKAIRVDLSAHPEKVIDLVHAKRAVFTEADVYRELGRYFEDRGARQGVTKAALRDERLLVMGQDEQGRSLYTTQEMVDVEKGIVDLARRMKEQSLHAVKEASVDKAVARYNKKVLRGKGAITDEQLLAIRGITSADQIGLVMGVAGAGKSTLIEVARDVWESEGYRVRGAALSGSVVSNLEESGIASSTLHALEGRIEMAQKMMADHAGKPLSKKQKEFIQSSLLDSKDVLVIDEAGMVGARQMKRVMDHARDAGAKVVLVGDHQQLQSIDAGAAFRTIVERNPYSLLMGVRRQRADWMQEATKDFASLKTMKALNAYDDRGSLKHYVTDYERMRGRLKDAGLSDAQINTIYVVDKYINARVEAGQIWYAAKERGVRIEDHEQYDRFMELQDIRGRNARVIVNNWDEMYRYVNRSNIDIQGLAADCVFASEDKVTRAEAEARAPYVVAERLDVHHVPEDKRGFSSREEAAVEPGGLSKLDAMADLVHDFMASYDASPDKSRLVLAYSRKDVASLNAMLRSEMVARGVVQGTDVQIKVKRKDQNIVYDDVLSFAKGDRVMFRENDKDLGVKNGSFGTVKKVEDMNMIVALDSGKKVKFNPKVYQMIEHGYAATVHKSQGATVDEAYVLAGRNFDRHATYVAMSRHRECVKLYGAESDFKDLEAMKEGLCRESGNLSTLDLVDQNRRLRDTARGIKDVLESIELDYRRGNILRSEADTLRSLMKEQDGLRYIKDPAEYHEVRDQYNKKANAYMEGLKERRKARETRRERDTGIGIDDD